MKNKRLWFSFLALVAAAVPAMAFAGFESGVEVTCSSSSTSGSCLGMLGAARRSSDAVQQMQCDTRGYANSPTREAFCWGKQADGRSRSCVSTATQMVAAAAAVSGDTYVSFQYNNGDCVYINALNTSYATPH